MAQQSKLLGRNGVKRIVCVCVHTCLCQSSQVSGRFCFLIRRESWLHWMSSLWRLTGIHALLKQCLPIYCACRPFQSQRTCSEHCFASRPVGEASVLMHFLRRQNWRASHWRDESDNYPLQQKIQALQQCQPFWHPVLVRLFLKFDKLLLPASILPVLLVSAAPALNARMMRQATTRICAMFWTCPCPQA